MKHIFFLSLFLITGTTTFSQHEIHFTKTSWEETLRQSTKTGKPVFVDAFTTWCGPCKLMERDVFTNKKVADFFNENFINFSMDMEKGVGPAVAKKYNIRGYPSFLFLNGDGTLLHRGIGYLAPDEFLKLGQTAIDPKNSLAQLDKQFEEGERSDEFLKKYVNEKLKLFDGSHVPAAETYLKQQKNPTSKENIEFVYKSLWGVSDELFDFFVNNKAAFEKRFGKRAVYSKLKSVVNNFSRNKITKDNSPEKIEALLGKAFPDKKEELSLRYRMSYYLKFAEDINQYAKTALAYYDKFPTDDAGELNGVGWTFYRVVDNKEYLKAATKLVKKSIKLDNRSYNNDTLAALYYKIGKKCKAKKAAKKAIKLAKKAGEDYSETENLLKKIMAL